MPPPERWPFGGKWHADTARAACLPVSTSGTMTPSAPASSARPIAVALSSSTRTRQGTLRRHHGDRGFERRAVEKAVLHVDDDRFGAGGDRRLDHRDVAEREPEHAERLSLRQRRFFRVGAAGIEHVNPLQSLTYQPRLAQQRKHPRDEERHLVGVVQEGKRRAGPALRRDLRDLAGDPLRRSDRADSVPAPPAKRWRYSR